MAASSKASSSRADPGTLKSTFFLSPPPALYAPPQNLPVATVAAVLPRPVNTESSDPRGPYPCFLPARTKAVPSFPDKTFYCNCFNKGAQSDGDGVVGSND